MKTLHKFAIIIPTVTVLSAVIVLPVVLAQKQANIDYDEMLERKLISDGDFFAHFKDNAKEVAKLKNEYRKKTTTPERKAEIKKILDEKSNRYRNFSPTTPNNLLGVFKIAFNKKDISKLRGIEMMLKNNYTGITIEKYKKYGTSLDEIIKLNNSGKILFNKKYIQGLKDKVLANINKLQNKSKPGFTKI